MSGARRLTISPPQFPAWGTLVEGPEAAPAVAVIGGSGGGGAIETAEWLAAEGFSALALEFFGRPGLPRGLRDIPLEYFRGALRFLASRPAAAHQPLCLLGVSR
ncbi:MAG TPA: hypothetical protein VJQ43_05470, partial [Thermoplasmata archaeon]|nr:hypothetical protein [Thermoplasmata archaeon]